VLLLLPLLVVVWAGLRKRNILMLPLLLLLLLLLLVLMWLVPRIPRRMPWGRWWWCLLPAHRSLRRDQSTN
jgi:hypothetical protein